MLPGPGDRGSFPPLVRVQIDVVMKGGLVVTEDERKAFYEAQKKVKEARDARTKPAAVAARLDDAVADVPPLSALPQGT